jgi:hypothetical protein
MQFLPSLVYALCFLTSAACTYLLFRRYRDTKIRMLLLSAICFFFLSVNNAILFVDLTILSQIDLTPLRVASLVLAVGILLVGFIWDLT